MLAIDTNVLVRYLTRDDARQAKRAAAAIDGGPVFIPSTVLLEAEWVLRTLYRIPPKEICAALRTLAGQPTVVLENAAATGAAMSWAEQGMDFADALHLAASSHCAAFISFDRSLAKRAKRIAGLPVRTP
ncbi:MAG: type II toxin-antitoxin system VapC family toxin [Hyphomonadaceae bacterium]